MSWWWWVAIAAAVPTVELALIPLLAQLKRWVALFVVFQLTSLTLSIVGLPLVTVLAAARAWDSSTPAQWRGGALTWLWSNTPDGIFGPNAGFWFPNSPRRSAIYWCGWRNRVNNLQFWRGASGTGRPEWIIHYGNRVFWAGWHSTDGWPVFHPFLAASALPT